uniref:Secreted protein n=1 Tax=Opuntia streptacantha TaxID=393608 RepID=A0A7C9EN08_OPUST
MLRAAANNCSLLILSLAEIPVVMRSISMVPVAWSVADCCNATSSSRKASATSRFSTHSENRILANASASRIRLSSCRGVAVITFLLLPGKFPLLLISIYPRVSSSAASSDNCGWICFFA